MATVAQRGKHVFGGLVNMAQVLMHENADLTSMVEPDSNRTGL